MSSFPIVALRILLVATALVTAAAQPAVLMRCDSSSFPRMRAIVGGMVAGDAASLSLTDNGTPCAPVHSAPVLRPRPSHVVVCVDLSNSVTEQRTMPIVSAAVTSIVDALSSRGIDVAIVFYDNTAHIACDFTRDAAALHQAMKRSFAGRSGSVQQALLHNMTGAFSLLSDVTSESACIIVTDGEDDADASQIMKHRTSTRTSIHTLCLGEIRSSCYRILADSTNGYVVSCRKDSLDAAMRARVVADAACGTGLHEILWTCPDTMTAAHAVSLRQAVGDSLRFTYSRGQGGQALEKRLEYAPHISLGGRTASGKVQTFISLSAVGREFVIDSVTVKGSNDFSVGGRYPLVVAAGMTENIPLTWLAVDSGFVWAQAIVHVHDEDAKSIGLSGGKAFRKPASPTLRILSPRGGEEIFVDTYLPITWEGSEPSDLHCIEQSTDGGRTWIVCKDSVRGSSCLWLAPADSARDLRLRVSHIGYAISGAAAGKALVIQQATMQAPMRIRDPRAFIRTMEMNPTIVGSRKDKIFDDILRNARETGMSIESVEFIGEHADEFSLCSYAFPRTLGPGAACSFEIRFMPRRSGVRTARMHIKTDAGYVTARVSGVAVEQSFIPATDPISFGSVSIGDVTSHDLPSALVLRGNRSHEIRRVELWGPDTTQFMLQPYEGPTRIAPGGALPLHIDMLPSRAGRTSAQVYVFSDADDSPHVIQLYADAVPYVRDRTRFRSILTPSAHTLAKGSLALGTANLLGLVAAYGVSDDVMIHAGGVLPLEINSNATLVGSIGCKASWEIVRNTRLGAGYQFAYSRSDEAATPAVDSRVTTHAPYAVVTHGTEDASISLLGGYAIKHHVTASRPDGFDSPAAFVAISGDVRVGARWKIVGEALSAQSLGSVPLTIALRYLGNRYAIEAGTVLTGSALQSSFFPSAIFPLLTATYVW